MKTNTIKNGKLIMKSTIESSINKVGLNKTIEVLTELQMVDYLKYVNLKYSK